MENNDSIYAAPESQLENHFIEETEIYPASPLRRLANVIIDQIAFIVLTLVTGILFSVIFGDAFIELIENTPEFLINFPFYILFYVFFESSFSRTPGKFITGTKVVDQNGQKPKLSQIFGRSLCRIIPFEVFSFLGPNTRGWHDSIPRTYVIESR